MASIKLRTGWQDRVLNMAKHATPDSGNAGLFGVAAAGLAKEIIDAVSDELVIHLDLIEDLTSRITALELICSGLRLELENRSAKP